MPKHHTVATPIFPVSELGAASDFYRSLGFEIVVYDRRYAFVVEDGTEILHLQVTSGRTGASAYLNVTDADARHARWQAVGANVTPVVDQEWGMREFELTGVSGNTLRVGTNF